MTDATKPEAPAAEAAPTPEATATEAAPTPEAEVDDPSIVGELTEEEKVTFTAYKRGQNSGILELGQMFYRGLQIANALDVRTSEFQAFSKALVDSKGLKEEGMQYQLLGNGKIRGIKNPQAVAAPPPAPVSESDAKVAKLEAALASAKSAVESTTEAKE